MTKGDIHTDRPAPPTSGAECDGLARGVWDAEEGFDSHAPDTVRVTASGYDHPDFMGPNCLFSHETGERLSIPEDFERSIEGLIPLGAKMGAGN